LEIYIITAMFSSQDANHLLSMSSYGTIDRHEFACKFTNHG